MAIGSTTPQRRLVGVRQDESEYTGTNLLMNTRGRIIIIIILPDQDKAPGEGLGLGLGCLELPELSYMENTGSL